MAPVDGFDRTFVRNAYGSCLSLLPSGVMRYITTQMDTIPKCLIHALMAMAICNFFLLISSLLISFMTFFAGFLLFVQNASILLVVSPQGQSMAPRLFNPTEFMMGVCLGITIGGTILSFFLCLTFGQFHAYCSHHPDGPQSCGWRVSGLNGVWWWSSCVFWLNLVSCFLLVYGHSDISSSSTSQQYQSLETDDPSMSTLSSESYDQNQYQQGQQTPAFAQRQQHVGYNGGYNNISDVVPKLDQTLPNAPNPLQNSLNV